MTSPKIIVIGSPNGKLGPIVAKLVALHSKNSFSCAIVTGDLFASEDDDDIVRDVIAGNIQFPLSTYFTLGTKRLPPSIQKRVDNDEDICENLIFLGSRGVITTVDKVRIVALGGRLDASLEGAEVKRSDPVFSRGDAAALRGAGTADILLTNSWPFGVQSLSKIPASEADKALGAVDGGAVRSSGFREISDLCAVLKPGYHFASSTGECFYEREPFLHASDDVSMPPKFTRFISMAPFGNAAKAKALYAFTLNTASTDIPEGTTASPFQDRSKSKHPKEGFSRFANSDHNDDRRKKRRMRAPSPPPGPDRCYFCLSNPNFETHMCASIGNECYLETAKGPIPTANTFAKDGIDFPCHFLIVPLSHAPTVAGMGPVDDPESDSVRTFTEMTRFRKALENMVATKSSNNLGLVTWEINRARNIHVHWQCLAAPKGLIAKGLVEAGFHVEAENLKFPPFKVQDLSLAEQAEAGDYFRIWITSNEGTDGEGAVSTKSLVMPLNADSRFDLQFGRRVMCKLLGLEDRTRWQDCAQSTEEETSDVERFQAAFKPWDFAVEGEE
ncbi:CWF19-like protein DRN1 [Ceratocystis fimbriata CBS 114723]|uniref:CWF19-like protein DRN1 n=1 Tax=Ceratocystis fimbriata CBS 114723 TaxID=1035309 RepID=A0A2C5XIM0_9PEZI|nr:CWF19-like protein DRN1 [Ceratocystis fimbriata CBS 114723]